MSVCTKDTDYIFIAISFERIFCLLINQCPLKTKIDTFREKREEDRLVKARRPRKETARFRNMCGDLYSLTFRLAMIDFTPDLVKAADLLRFEKKTTKRLGFGALISDDFRSRASALRCSFPFVENLFFPSSCRTRQRETNIRSIFHLRVRKWDTLDRQA